MPWTARDAYGHTKTANTPALQSQWSTVANNVLEQTGDEARAIKAANAAVDKTTRRPNRRAKSSGMAGPQPIPGDE